MRRKILSHAIPSGSPRKDNPDVGAVVPGPPAIIAENRLNRKPCPSQSPRHLRDRERPECQIEAVFRGLATATLAVDLLENRHAAPPVVTDGFDEREVRA